MKQGEAFLSAKVKGNMVMDEQLKKEEGDNIDNVIPLSAAIKRHKTDRPKSAKAVKVYAHRWLNDLT